MEAEVVRWGDDLAVRLSAEEVRALGLSEDAYAAATYKNASRLLGLQIGRPSARLAAE